MSLSALEAILERGKGGIWFLPAHMDPAAVRKAAKEAGFAFFHIDGKTIARKEQLLNHMATTMGFPKEFGHNWDALEDIDALLTAHPDQFETLVEILRDAVSSWKEDGTAMVVLLSGAKAPKGVAKVGAKDDA